MKLHDGRITIPVSEHGTTIEIIDSNASTTFCRIKLTPEQFSQALGRLSHTKCEVEVVSLDRVGKMHENQKFTFEIPKELKTSAKSKDLHELAKKNLSELEMTEWTPDEYFSSQDTFYEKDGKYFANVTIRRWTQNQHN